jgi:hypothetical protein
MQLRFLAPATLCALLPVSGAAQQPSPDSSRAATRAALERHVRSLAADALKGRMAGTSGGALAAHYVVTEFDAIKVLPAVPTTTCDRSGRCEWTYFQPVRGRGMAAPNVEDLARMTTMDVAVPGADDNASGVATVIELARRIAAAPVRRPVMFVLFADFGFGAREFLESLQQPADSIAAMFNVDMVGRLNAGRLEINGSSTSRSWRSIIDSAAAGTKMRIVSVPTVRGREHGFDHVPFSDRGVPDGLLRVVEFAEQVIRLTGDGVRPWRAR